MSAKNSQPTDPAKAISRRRRRITKLTRQRRLQEATTGKVLSDLVNWMEELHCRIAMAELALSRRSRKWKPVTNVADLKAALEREVTGPAA